MPARPENRPGWVAGAGADEERALDSGLVHTLEVARDRHAAAQLVGESDLVEEFGIDAEAVLARLALGIKIDDDVYRLHAPTIAGFAFMGEDLPMLRGLLRI